MTTDGTMTPQEVAEHERRISPLTSESLADVERNALAMIASPATKPKLSAALENFVQASSRVAIELRREESRIGLLLERRGSAAEGR